MCIRDRYKINTSANQGFYIEPSKGQFNDGGRGDNAYTYITRFDVQKEEGENDLVTIGPCCNTNFEQGPEKFINQESINNTDVYKRQILVWLKSQLSRKIMGSLKFHL